MNNRHGWLIMIALGALLLAACGPQMSTPTVGAPASKVTSTSEAAAATSAPTAAPATQVAAVPASELPVDPDDWRALGEPDAPVTIIEYSDFQ